MGYELFLDYFNFKKATGKTRSKSDILQVKIFEEYCILRKIKEQRKN